MIDVRCPQCATIFELDERQMRGAAATLQCSVCQHLFRIENTHRTPDQENHRRWMVRAKASGDILYFTGFDTLHRWIIERRVGALDEISRTGAKWTRLEQIGEFAPIFQVVESISMLTANQPEPAPALPQRPLSTPAPQAPRHTIQQFAQPRQEPSAPQAPRHPTLPPSARRSGPLPQPQFQPQAPSPQPARPGALPTPTPIRQPTPHAAPRQTPIQQQPSPQPAPQRPQPEETQDEAWSLGNLPPATQLQSGRFGALNAEDSDSLIDEPPKRSRAPLIAGLVILLVGLGVGGFFAKDQLLAALGQGPTAQLPAPNQPVEPNTQLPEPPTAIGAAEPWVEPLDGALNSAYVAAFDAASTENTKIFGEAHKAADAKLIAAQEGAAKHATEEAEGPSADKLIKKADRAFSRESYEQARSLYHQALDLDGRSLPAITGLGWSLFMVGKTDAAIAQFQRAIHTNAAYEDAYIGLGKAERSRGRLKEALAAYEDYLDKFPQGKKASIARYQRDQIKQALGQ